MPKVESSHSTQSRYVQLRACWSFISYGTQDRSDRDKASRLRPGQEHQESDPIHSSKLRVQSPQLTCALALPSAFSASSMSGRRLSITCAGRLCLSLE